MSHRLLVHESIARLRPHAPFDTMREVDLQALVEQCELVYLPPGAILIDPGMGPPDACWIVRDGVLIQNDAQGRLASVWTVGDPLPVGALLAGRPVSTAILAQGDVFCWKFPVAAFHALVARSEAFRQYCQGRLAHLNAASREALRIEISHRVAQDRLMERPVRELLRRAAVQVSAQMSLESVFRLMEREQVGSVIVGEAEGIFTRQDVIARVSLPGLSLQTPIKQVMSSPLITLDATSSVAEAMLSMASHGIRHLALVHHEASERSGQSEHSGHPEPGVPPTSRPRLIGVVTERDLVSMQRQSLSSLSVGIARAESIEALALSAQGIREWAALLVAQGVHPAFMTALISRLNDQLTRRVLLLRAQSLVIPLEQACWLALGSEGREEQTISTDQDNALLLPEGGAGRSLPEWLAFARAVNDDLAACGYPLCKGGIMASNPQWCLELPQWRERFAQWIGQGSPASLLNAAIFFDFRALAGNALLARQLRAEVQEQAKRTPRFLKQMSDQALRNGPPASLAGRALTAWLPGADDEVLDLKLHGTMPLVDGARLLALAHGIEATGTEARLRELAVRGRIEAKEQAAWVEAFHFFQILRLRSQHQELSGRHQHAPEGAEGGQVRPQDASDGPGPNCLRMNQLSAIEQRALRESWRQMRRLQQRLALDFPG